MLNGLVIALQAAAAAVLAWGALLCLARRDRRRYQTSGSDVIHPGGRRGDRPDAEIRYLVDLRDASSNRNNDFAIGYRRSEARQRRAA